MIDIRDVLIDVRFKCLFSSIGGSKIYPLIKCSDNTLLYPLVMNNGGSKSYYILNGNDFLDIDKQYETVCRIIDKHGGIDIKKSIDEIFSHRYRESNRICEF